MRRKKEDPNQRSLGDISREGKAKALFDRGLTEFIVQKEVTYDEAQTMNGQFEARWETPEGAFCKTFTPRSELESLRPGDKLLFTATLKIKRGLFARSDAHLCDSM